MITTPTRERVDEIVTRTQATSRAPSLVAAVIRGGRIAHCCAAGTTPTPALDLQYRLGSVTKTMTAAVVLGLRDAGHLNLDDLVTTHLPTVDLPGVRLRHLLGHASGLQREPDIAHIAAETGAGLVIMHTGRGREDEKRPDVIEDQFVFLRRSLEIAHEAGVKDSQIVLDPGFGFAKDREEDLSLMARTGELHALGYPLLIGTSRKRMIGHLAGDDRLARDVGTSATSVILRLQGAHVFRVHNIPFNRDALAFADAVLARQLSRPAQK